MKAVKTKQKSKLGNRKLRYKIVKNKKNTPNVAMGEWNITNKLKEYEKVTELDDLSIINTISQVTPKVQRVLPHWLRHPKNIQADVLKNQKELNCFSPILDSVLMETLRKNNIHYLFPVQCSVMKSILSDAHGMEFRYRPRDVCVAAPTGSGKTLTYVLPIVQILSKRNITHIRALIILPVTELAAQVAEEMEKYATPYGLVVGSVFGSKSISAEEDIMLQNTVNGHTSKIDILVCTPGRLAIHLSQTSGLDFSKLRFIVLDEADHLLTGDWSDTISGILRSISCQQKTSANVLPPNWIPAVLSHASYDSAYPAAAAQKLLFSATLSHNPQQLRVVELHNPLLFATSNGEADPIITEGRTGEFVRPANLTEEYVITDGGTKALCLYRILLKEHQLHGQLKALVFANTVEVVHRLSILLAFMAADQFKVESFSSAIKKRRSVLRDFQAGKINVLISTDAMARGIDVQNIGCIVSYEVVGSNIYTHRAGRTARAGNPGKSISIVTSDEMGVFRKVLGRAFSKAAQLKLPTDADNYYDEKYQRALTQLSDCLKKEIKSGRSSKFTNLKPNSKRLRKFVATS